MFRFYCLIDHPYLYSQMHLDLSFLEWALAVLCGIMVGMSKTGVAGIGNLVVPIMALIFGGRPSGGLLLPMLIMADVFGVTYYHRAAEWRYVLRLLPWGLAGVGIGVVVGKHISDLQFKQLIGGIVVFSLAVMVWQDFRKKKEVPHEWYFAAFFGLLGGFTTMIGNAAGPIMSVFFLSMNLPKNNYVGTAAWYFMIVNVIKLPFQIWVWGNVSIQTLTFDLMMLPAIAVGAFLGIRLVKRISDNGYRWFVMAATFVSALLLFI